MLNRDTNKCFWDNMVKIKYQDKNQNKDLSTSRKRGQCSGHGHEGGGGLEQRWGLEKVCGVMEKVCGVMEKRRWHNGISRYIAPIVCMSRL